jgi:hypothetical protein
MVHSKPKNEYAVGKTAKEFALEDERNLRAKNQMLAK